LEDLKRFYTEGKRKKKVEIERNLASFENAAKNLLETDSQLKVLLISWTLTRQLSLQLEL